MIPRRDWRRQAWLIDRVASGRRAYRPEEWRPYRDHAAVLITDMSGFTRLITRHGPARMVLVIRWMRGVARPIFLAGGGELVKWEADDLFAVFPDAGRALRCAVALSRAFERPSGLFRGPVSLCMGIGMGDVLWWGPDDLYGLQVNLASKLGEDTAGAGEILLTRAAAADARSRLPDARFRKGGAIRVGCRTFAYSAYAGGL